MAFNQKDWEARLAKAQTQDEFTELIDELPQGDGHEMSEEAREFFTMEQRMISQHLTTSTTKTAKTSAG